MFALLRHVPAHRLIAYAKLLGCKDLSMKPCIFSTFVAASLTVAGPAFAHAHLTEATPAAGAIVQEAPTKIELRFSEGVEAPFAKIEIKGAGGQDVPIKSIVGVSGDKKTLLVTPATPIAAGMYQIFWTIVSVDTHKSEGTYSFTIKP